MQEAGRKGEAQQAEGQRGDTAGRCTPDRWGQVQEEVQDEETQHAATQDEEQQYKAHQGNTQQEEGNHTEEHQYGEQQDAGHGREHVHVHGNQKHTRRQQSNWSNDDCWGHAELWAHPQGPAT